MREKCCLVIAKIKGKKDWDNEDLTGELKSLTTTARGEVSEVIVVNIENITPKYYIGEGKIKEMALKAKERGWNTIIFNNNLAPAQQRNIKDEVKINVIDRTQLILDIFAHRARTSEGKIQVELAQLNYRLPRLATLGEALSQLGGGIGTRGPGETMLETDRRHIRRRISTLKKQLEDVAKRRDLERASRKRVNLPRIAVVGYTNAGKSTLVNNLSGSDIFVEDKLFATLDPTTRKVERNGYEFLLTDTVGFIRDMPQNLMAAFRATMEELVEADAVIHLLDASHPKQSEMEVITRSFLTELGAGDKKRLLVLNKIDALGEEEKRRVLREYGDSEAVVVSAKTGEGLKELCLRLMHMVGDGRQLIKAAIPATEGRLLWEIHEDGGILKKEYGKGKVFIEARLNKGLAQRLKQYTETEVRNESA